MQNICEKIIESIMVGDSEDFHLSMHTSMEFRMDLMYVINDIVEELGYHGLVSLNTFADDSGYISYTDYSNIGLIGEGSGDITTYIVSFDK